MYGWCLIVAVDGNTSRNAEQGGENSWCLYYDASDKVIDYWLLISLVYSIQIVWNHAYYQTIALYWYVN